MKYIKTYETGYINDLKKYMICKDDQNGGDDPYVVIELIRTTEDFSIVIKVLVISKKDQLIAGKSEELTINTGLIKSRIVFQSDDINEVKEKLYILQTKHKFNI